MTASLSNGEIAQRLVQHAELLAVAGENTFRSRAFLKAAEAVRMYPESIAEVAAEGRLRDIDGVGEGIATAIEQILNTGSFEAHSALTRQFPESLITLTSVPGVGSKTAQRLFQELGVDDLPALEAALVDGRIARTKGLGPRTEATVRAGLESLARRTGRAPLGSALPLAQAFLETYAATRPTDIVSLAGSARRWETTVGDLDFVVASSEPEAVFPALAKLPLVTIVATTENSRARLLLGGSIEADLYITSPASFGSVLVRATGNSAHLKQLGPIAGDFVTEADAYSARSLPWIPPELRQGTTEFSRWSEISSLVTLDAINGEFHAHTRWSDGTASILDMAEAAAGRGYVFLGITDHSHGLGVAGGLDAARIREQRRELDAINREASIRLLAGSEVEVDAEGRLDFSDEELSRLDVVVASLHSGLRQPRSQITDRLVRVLSNPHVDIIAHPSGRLIERREGGDFDWQRVFSVSADTGTALEINADPARLDLDPHLAAHAAAAGCLITINCDAHRPDGFVVMEYGVAMARRAWLTPAQILNCWPREDVMRWLSAHQRPSVHGS